tara:strand:+ start:73 stop:375 length:303 start_codon:yes stop_codon:yes gene_type:complete
MTLDDAVKHQQVQDKRAIRSDTLEFLNQKYFSKSKQKHIRYGDMHLDHFFRVFINKTENDQLLGFMIDGIMQNIISHKQILPTQAIEIIKEEIINAKKKH